MALEVLPQHEDLILYEILRHPVFCWEFIQNLDKLEHEELFVFDDYQQEFICDFAPEVSLCCARAVGKCLHEDSKILNIVTGEYKTVGELFKSSKNIVITAINEDTLSQTTDLVEISDNGVQEVLEITAQKGYKTKVTKEHPFMTPTGWVQASNLKKNDWIAVPTSLPYFGDEVMDESELKYLAYFISEGSRDNGSITTSDSESVWELKKIARDFGGSLWRDTGKGSNGFTWHLRGQRRLRLLEEYNLRYCYSYEKFVPDVIFSLRKEQIALFLNRLFCADGWVSISKDGRADVGYCSSSEQLARDIKHLLLRFGIISNLSFSDNGYQGRWTVSINDQAGITQFATEIGFFLPRKAKKLQEALELKKSTLNDTSDIIPIPNFENYKYLRNDSPYPRKLSSSPTREKLKRVLNLDTKAERLSNPEVRWVRVRDVVSAGLAQTYSITNPTSHTLVADDIYSHNTESLSGILVWTLVTRVFEEYVVYTVPNKAQLEPVWQRITRMFRTNSLLKNLVETKKGVNSGTNQIFCKHGATLMCRIAGTTGDGRNVIGLHTPFQVLDEAGYYPWGTYLEFQPTWNTWTPGRRKMVSGVPTGMRENNVLYHADMENDNFTKHRIPSSRNSRYSEEDEQRNRELYGGPESEDYIHNVMGRHGRPVFALFDRNLLKLESYGVYKIQFDGLKLRENISDYFDKLDALPPAPRDRPVLFGIDLGYTDPTSIIIMYIDTRGNFKFHARILLRKVPYPVQAQIIDSLDTRFKPVYIGVDVGNAGKSEVQRLHLEPQYARKNYIERLVPIDFGANVVVGYDNEKKEITEKTKPFSISLLQEFSNEHRVVYSSTDLELVTELERMVYVTTPSGNKVYRTLTTGGGKRGEDHITASLLCAIMVWYLKNEQINPPKNTKLIAGRWNR